ncbi:MAG: M42 family metallopeptidase [Candidatus Coatesbacteria bacterium]|nr:M42 family metallopeptidase [Candidatus Coatesbacteria bacterium]
MSKEGKDILNRLSDAFGPPGFEDEVRGIMRDELGSFCKLDTDRIGSIICTKEGYSKTPKIMLAAHMDEIGFMVQGIRPDGCATLVNLGGWRASDLPGTVVTLKTENGYLRGVIGSVPVHFTRSKPGGPPPPPTIEKLFVDFGAKDRDDAARFGVKVGTPFVPYTVSERLLPGDMYLGKGWDDRAGCAVVVESMKRLKNEKHPNTVYGVGTVQEEVGSKGAGVTRNIIKPDVAIVLEGSPANDTLGPVDEAEINLGGGPQIRFYDPTMLPNRPLVELLIKTAESHDIPYQVVVRRSGGTDGRAIQLTESGVPCVVISVVCRYIHSSAGLLSRCDFENTVELLYWFMKEYDEAKNREITTF